MKVAIVGSRDFPFPGMVTKMVNELPPDTVVVSGGARGVDTYAEMAAAQRGLEVLIFPADWRKHGNAAGYIRNRKIVEAADRVVAYQYRKSRGTQHTIDIARAMKKPVEVVEVGVTEES